MADVLLSTIIPGGTPTGTGFRHVTSGTEDSATVAETGSGSVVRDTGATLVNFYLGDFDLKQTAGTLRWDTNTASDEYEFGYNTASTWFRLNSTNAIFGGNVYAGTGVFSSSGANAIVSSSGVGGGVYLRPNGSGSSTGQLVIDPSGNVSMVGEVFFGTALKSTTGTSILATTGAGTIYFRPNGSGSATGQVVINSAGQITTVNDLTVGGTLTLSNFINSSTAALYLSTTGAGTVTVRPNGVGSASGQMQVASDGTLTINSTAGAATSQPVFVATNGTRSLYMLPWVGGGSYNGSNQAGDVSVMGLGSAVDLGVLNLTTWSNTSVGVRITNNSVTVTGTTTVTGTLTGTSTVSDSLGNLRITPVTNTTGSGTLTIINANTAIRKSNSTAQTWTIPPNSSVAYPIGTVLTFHNAGGTTLNMTVARGVGVSMYNQSATSADITLTPGQSVTVHKTDTDTWQTMA